MKSMNKSLLICSSDSSSDCPHELREKGTFMGEESDSRKGHYSQEFAFLND